MSKFVFGSNLKNKKFLNKKYYYTLFNEFTSEYY